ncbi:uncharacterized protein LOC133541565 [Nerophis ophidion]|uniref:uncharacterized protein LOC133541565 n=1 Tax=Nerophis ophidion TaxID=159077 RepID=UPI002AE07BF4|nr:uncharacterized protein LOC133541565 [Nerophis ophidion]
MDSQSHQLLLVGPNDTRRLLEVYVKRSLSFNDGSLDTKPCERQAKWVTLSKKHRRHRRHSSDPSLHSTERLNDHVFATEPLDRPETQPDDKMSRKPRKNKKLSLWKTFIGRFSRRSTEDHEEVASDIPEASSVDEDLTIATACLPASPPLQKKRSSRRRSIKRMFSKRRPSLIKFSREGPNPVDITGVEAVVSVEPTYSYYEKVSQELEKILNEVKENEEVVTLSDEEVIDRIIALTKDEGDAIDVKIRDSTTLSNFFKGMSYSSFQRLADAYLKKEASPRPTPTSVLPTAPELVQLAFTLDFTARIARLSLQNVGHITGLGGRYLQDRFEYKQACSDHPF